MTPGREAQGGHAGMESRQRIGERVRWCAYPSWAHFAWLYAFSLMAGGRGLLAWREGTGGWSIWMGGAVALLVCVAALRRWARYSFTSDRVIVSNGYTGRDIQTLSLDDLSEVTVMQGPLAQFLGIGTVVLRSLKGDLVIHLRGVRDPEVIRTRLEALRP
jgi:membrane protein YdbS with pleckstrin-like domain